MGMGDLGEREVPRDRNGEAREVGSGPCSPDGGFRQRDFEKMDKASGGLNPLSEFDISISQTGGNALTRQIDEVAILSGEGRTILDVRPLGRVSWGERRHAA